MNPQHPAYVALCAGGAEVAFVDTDQVTTERQAVEWARGRGWLVAEPWMERRYGDHIIVELVTVVREGRDLFIACNVCLRRSTTTPPTPDPYCCGCSGRGRRRAFWAAPEAAPVAMAPTPSVPVDPHPKATPRTEVLPSIRRREETMRWEARCQALRANLGIPVFIERPVGAAHVCGDGYLNGLGCSCGDCGLETNLCYCAECGRVGVLWDSDWTVPVDLAPRIEAALATLPDGCAA